MKRWVKNFYLINIKFPEDMNYLVSYFADNEWHVYRRVLAYERYKVPPQFAIDKIINA